MAKRRRWYSEVDWLVAGVYLFVTVAVLVLVLGAWALRSSWEAESFNRLTGSNVSTWDAMFLELRVIEPHVPAPADA